jgi:uncharacterized membrane protein YqjE
MEMSPFRNPAGRAGFFSNSLALVDALVSFFVRRFRLFSRESKAALGRLLALLMLLVTALLFFVFGYIFLIATAVASVAALAQVPWLWIALIAAALHIVLALICLLSARAIMQKPVFGETAAELRKDREWLRKLDETTRSIS